jgi:hypothetical protein
LYGLRFYFKGFISTNADKCLQYVRNGFDLRIYSNSDNPASEVKAHDGCICFFILSGTVQLDIQWQELGDNAVLFLNAYLPLGLSFAA